MLNSDEQYIWNPSLSPGGEVRRYPFNTSLLNELKRQHADIWRVTATDIDVVFTPSMMQDGSQLLQHDYVVLPIQLPERVEESQTIPEFDENEEVEFARKHKYFDLKLLSHDFHSQYHSTANITHFMRSLTHTFPNHTSLVHIGHSFLGRKLLGIKVAKKEPVPVGAKPRKAFVIMGAQHAREWIATSTSLYLAHALAVNASAQSSKDAHHSLYNLLDKFEFHIIPLPNPDGYEYTRKHDRLWYKNRQLVSAGRGKACKGMDMNRNWGYEWLPAEETDADPCAHWYPGSRPFEAHEVNALASYLTYRTGGPDAVVGFLDLRSYGQTLSAPFSYSCDIYPRDAEDQIEAGLGCSPGFVESARAPGNIVDWAYAAAGIKYAYANHLRDSGTYGYMLPSDFIRPTGEETAALVRYLATFIAKDPKTM
ncbi:related to carboxypeptidase [Serendipita indica DSM 11827]|uniref:Inactive metallocarboxypeptidase ECM14 n=1 Tax=Serendipita indica (strain DSM 11827) TaxID=1109443 RepID=G4TMA2_SERID|nr:related to carboxypeptidase [Serendipita indica DSM 11827]